MLFRPPLLPSEAFWGSWKAYNARVFCEPDLESNRGNIDSYWKLGKDLTSHISSVNYKDKSSKMCWECTSSQVASAFYTSLPMLPLPNLLSSWKKSSFITSLLTCLMTCDLSCGTDTGRGCKTSNLLTVGHYLQQIMEIDRIKVKTFHLAAKSDNIIAMPVKSFLCCVRSKKFGHKGCRNRLHILL